MEVQTRFCTKCGVEKSLDAFHDSPNGKYGKRSECKECKRIRSQRWYKDNRDKSLQRSNLYRLEHPEWAKEMDKRHHENYDWKEKFPEKAADKQRKDSIARRFRIHGTTQIEYEKMLLDQGTVCAVCGLFPTTSPVKKSAVAFDNFVIDHDHVTGKIRGIVCNTCNVALGMIRDNPETARKLATYLEAFGRKCQDSQENSGLEVQSCTVILPSEVGEQLNSFL